MVHVREYSGPLDLRGRDLISLLGRSKEDVSRLVGTIAEKPEMQTEELPGAYVTTMTGEIADEVHEYPDATLGPEFRYLVLQFRARQLIHIRWKFQAVGAVRKRRPWWQFWRD